MHVHFRILWDRTAPRPRVCVYFACLRARALDAFISNKTTAANRRNMTLASFQWKNAGFPLPSRVFHVHASFEAGFARTRFVLVMARAPKNYVRTNRLMNFQVINA